MEKEEILEKCQQVQRLLLGKRSVFVDVTNNKEDVITTLTIFDKRGKNCNVFTFYLFLGDDYVMKKWREVEKYINKIR